MYINSWPVINIAIFNQRPGRDGLRPQTERNTSIKKKKKKKKRKGNTRKVSMPDSPASEFFLLPLLSSTFYFLFFFFLFSSFFFLFSFVSFFFLFLRARFAHATFAAGYICFNCHPAVALYKQIYVSPQLRAGKKGGREKGVSEREYDSIPEQLC